MASVTTPKQLQAIRDLPFCHVCGKTLGEADAKNRDHIPPKTCFDLADRDPPLKLATHVKCNNDSKLNDEKVGELIAAQRRKSLPLDEGHLNVQVLHHAATGEMFAAFDNLDVEGAMRRWVGGFHAALYQRPLAPQVPFAVSLPLPRARVSDEGIRPHPIAPYHEVFVETIKLNRAANNLDMLRTNRGKLRYECVWAREDNAPRWLCIFALDLYGWIELGDAKHFGARGCVGCYVLAAEEVPPNASRATRIVATVANGSPFDPFGN
jgi:hypothetical protein